MWFPTSSTAASAMPSFAVRPLYAVINVATRTNDRLVVNTARNVSLVPTCSSVMWDGIIPIRTGKCGVYHNSNHRANLALWVHSLVALGSPLVKWRHRINLFHPLAKCTSRNTRCSNLYHHNSKLHSSNHVNTRR